MYVYHHNYYALFARILAFPRSRIGSRLSHTPSPLTNNRWLVGSLLDIVGTRGDPMRVDGMLSSESVSDLGIRVGKVMDWYIGPFSTLEAQRIFTGLAGSPPGCLIPQGLSADNMVKVRQLKTCPPPRPPPTIHAAKIQF